jgi:enamine deaminase RidA (YjgF/YER057c/UK114 family)
VTVAARAESIVISRSVVSVQNIKEPAVDQQYNVNELNEWPAYVTAGPFMFFSGQMGRRQGDSSLIESYADAPNARGKSNTSFEWVGEMEAPVGAQGIAIYERYLEMLSKEGSNLNHLLRYHIYQRDKHFFSVFDRIRRGYETKPPASTAVGLGRFEPSDRATLCIDAIALRDSAVNTIGPRTVLAGASRHIAAATFSHVVNAGPYLFLAGQIPIDTSKPGAPLIRGYDDIPEEGAFLRVGRSHEDTRNGPIAAQTWYTYDLIRKHLEAAESSLEQVLNLIVYLQDMRDFPIFHRIHEHFFKSNPPALTVVQATEVGHKGTLIEIEATAILPGRGVERRIIAAEGWKAPAHMSACVCAGGLTFFSGIAGVDEPGREAASLRTLSAQVLERLVHDSEDRSYAVQAASAIAELRRTVEAAGGNLNNIVHLTIGLRDINRFHTVEGVLIAMFGTWRPALTVLELPAVAPVRDARVSITAIGWLS